MRAPGRLYCIAKGGLAVVAQEPTGPYLPEWMICSAHPHTGSPAVVWLTLAIVVLAVRPRRRRAPT